MYSSPVFDLVGEWKLGFHKALTQKAVSVEG